MSARESSRIGANVFRVIRGQENCDERPQILRPRSTLPIGLRVGNEHTAALSPAEYHTDANAHSISHLNRRKRAARRAR